MHPVMFSEFEGDPTNINQIPHNQPVARVSQVDTVYVNVNVPDDDLAYVRPGTPVSFSTTPFTLTMWPSSPAISRMPSSIDEWPLRPLKRPHEERAICPPRGAGAHRR